MYGKIEDWSKWRRSKLVCNGCGEPDSCQWMTKNGKVRDLCTPCYIKHVIEPNTEPITEVTEELVGREVVVVRKYKMLNVGDIMSIGGIGKFDCIRIKENSPVNGYDANRFRLLPKKIKPVDITEVRNTIDKWRDKRWPTVGQGKWSEPIEDDGPPKNFTTLPETTFSCTLEFPNGDVVEIPGPGDGWIGEETRYDWPHKYWGSIVISPGVITQKSGLIIYMEYTKRIEAEKPRIISITKWTRDPNWQPEPEVDWKDEAVRRAPELPEVDRPYSRRWKNGWR